MYSFLANTNLVRDLATAAANRVEAAVTSTVAAAAAAANAPLTNQCCVGLCAHAAKFKCVICARRFCKEHQQNGHTMQKGIFPKTTDKYSVPEDLKMKREKATGLGSTVANFAAASAASLDTKLHGNKEFVCCWPLTENDTMTCKDKCVQRFLAEFEAERLADVRVDLLKCYLEKSGEDCETAKALFVYEKPSIEDTTANRVLVAGYKGVEAALSVAPTPIVILGTVALYGLQAKFLLEMLKESFGIENNIVELMFALKKPMMHSLSHMSRYCSPETAKALSNLTYKEIAYDIVPSIFYLSRNHIFAIKSGDSGLAQAMDGAVVCPRELLERMRPCIGPAAWLYLCKLPGVHNTPEWMKWYMQRVLARDGWTLVGTSVDAHLVPRMEHELELESGERDSTKSKTVYVDKPWTTPAFGLAIRDKDAVLFVRGTQSALDWTINLNGLPEKITYNIGRQGDGDSVDGIVHGGFYRGAEAILQHCHMFEAVDKLIGKGYSVRLIGHSLGAATAVLMAMLLKARFVAQRRQGIRKTVPYIPAIAFGVPPCVAPALSDALAADELVISAVHEYDIVPRLSESNILPLAEEVFKYKPHAEGQLSEDMKAFKAYAGSLGKASRIAKDNGTAAPNAESDDRIEAKAAAEDGLVSVEEEPVDDPVEAAPEADAVEQAINVPEELDVLVVPGKIAFFAKGTDGRMRAALVDHRFATLQSIKLLDTCCSDHNMANYSIAFRDATMGMFGIPKHEPPKLQASILNNNYVPCGVCCEDVVWPYLTKSVACRASATRNCAICGKIVCSVCAPGGEKVPGDGYGQESKLDDLRQSLPSMSLFQPQRLCLPCYFKHYDY